MPDTSLDHSLADLCCIYLNAGMSARDIAVALSRCCDKMVDHAATIEVDDRIEFKVMAQYEQRF